MRRVFLAGLLFFLAASGYAQNSYPPLVSTVTFAGLGTSANNGTIRYCRDCDATSPCAGSGVGAFALRVNGAWECSSTGSGGGLSASGGTGIIVETAPGVTAARTITNTDGLLTVQNGDGVAANPIISINTSTVPIYSQGTPDPPATCTVGEFYFETDQFDMYWCDSTDHWQLILSQASATDDTTLVGNGTTFQLKALADCDDSSGNHLNYDTTTNAFSCGTSSSGAGATAATAPTSTIWREEFTSGLGTDGNVGDLNWQLSLTGAAGTGASSLVTEPNHPGIFVLTSGATDNAGPAVFSTTIDPQDYTTEEWDMVWIIRPVSAVTATHISIGLVEGGPIATTAAIRAFYDTDLAHATWIFQICDSATTGCQSAGDDTNADTVASTKVPTNGTWQAVRIRKVTAGVGGNPTYYFSVGDTGAYETEKTFCSSGCDEDLGNLPSTQDPAVWAGVIARAAATSKDLQLDFFWMTITGQVRF